MGLNKQERFALKVKQLSNGNIKCFQILCELYDAGREDILDELVKVMGDRYDGITPEQIVRTYDSCGGKDGFLKRCNKLFNKRSLARERKEADYEYHLLQYNCGERKDHPDGTRFEDGKEINYD